MATTLIYETHSTTTDNEDGIATGWLPGRLSELGREQARELGERRRGEEVSAIFSSDLARAVETAELAFGHLGIPIYHDARLRECNYGEMNGMPLTRLAPERASHIDEPFPGGQSYREVVDLMHTFLSEIAATWDGRRVIVIAHSANRWALDALLKGVRLEELVDAPFDWQPGWRYEVPSGWPLERG